MDTPINPDIELRKKISLENFKILRHKRALQEMKIQQRKIALERLEVAINTFTSEACFLKLSENGNVVGIQFEDGTTNSVFVNDDSGIKMLYDVLKYGFIGVKVNDSTDSENDR